MKRIVLALLFILHAAPSFGAITILDAFTSLEADDCDPCTLSSYTLSAGTNRKVVCVVATEDGTAATNFSGATFGGNAMTQVVARSSTTTFNRVAIYELNEANLPAAGARDLVVDMTDVLSDIVGLCGTLQNVSQGAVRDTDSAASDTTNTASLTITGIQATDFMLMACTINNNSGANGRWSWGTDQTEILDQAFATSNTAEAGASWEIGEGSPSCTSASAAARFAAVAAAWAEAVATTRRQLLPVLMP